ncbi:MAG: hypothetical protein ACE5GA_03790 [Candidatus Zixiibacteriota bacterium]
MKRVTLLSLALALVILAGSCSKERQEQIGGAPSRAKVKAAQVEAQQLLRQISAMQRTYYRTFKRYSSDLNEIGVTLPSNAAYRYDLRASGSSWSCTATANLDNDATVDRWVVDQGGRISCATNDATS